MSGGRPASASSAAVSDKNAWDAFKATPEYKLDDFTGPRPAGWGPYCEKQLKAKMKRVADVAATAAKTGVKITFEALVGGKRRLGAGMGRAFATALAAPPPKRPAGGGGGGGDGFSAMWAASSMGAFGGGEGSTVTGAAAATSSGAGAAAADDGDEGSAAPVAAAAAAAGSSSFFVSHDDGAFGGDEGSTEAAGGGAAAAIQRGRPLHGRGRGRRSGSGFAATLALRAAPEALESKAADKVAARSSGREDLAEAAEESGLTVLRGATGKLINAAFLAHTLGLHGTGGYAGAVAREGAQREVLAEDAGEAGLSVRRGASGSLLGASHLAHTLQQHGVGGYVGPMAATGEQREELAAAAEDAGMPVRRGVDNTLLGSMHLAHTLGRHNAGGYAGAAAAAGEQREELAAAAEDAGMPVRRGIDGALHGAGHAALALGQEGAGGYAGAAAAAALAAEKERAARRDEYAAYMGQHGIIGALDAAGITRTARSLVDEQQSSLGGRSIRQFLALHNAGMYAGITLLTKPQDEAYAWLTARGHEERLGPGEWTQTGARNLPVLSWTDGRVITGVEAVSLGIEFAVVYTSVHKSNVAGIERELHSLFQDLPLGRRLWRAVGRGAQGYMVDAEDVGDVVYKLYITFTKDMGALLGKGVIINERR